MQILNVLLIIGAIGLFFIPFAIGVWVLRPLDRAAKNRQAPVRFTLLDFLGLIFLLQVPMALIHSLIVEEVGPTIWVIDGFAWGSIAMIWGVAIKTFSQAGIRNVYRRGVLVFLVLPMAYLGSFAVVIVPIAIYHAAQTSGLVVLLVFVEIILIVAICYSAHFTRRVARETIKDKFFAIQDSA